MEHALIELFSRMHWAALSFVIVLSLWTLAKSADWLVSEAVILSERSGISKMVIAATIISLGTTMPEAAVSVLAAFNGSPGLALGNSVGSIVCDTGLILGLACIISPLRLDRRVVNRQGWIQIGAALALVIASVSWTEPARTFAEGGNLPRAAGIIFVALLAAYIWWSIHWARKNRPDNPGKVSRTQFNDSQQQLFLVFLKLVAAIGGVVISARILIPAISEAALRAGIPDSIIAATMVAFGTSLPEMITAVTAARRGQGEIAVGNVIGADILNVLFVSGTAAAVTSGGLDVGRYFFLLHYPAMIVILLTFRVGIVASGKVLKRTFGFGLLGLYSLYILLSYLVPGL